MKLAKEAYAEVDIVVSESFDPDYNPEPGLVYLYFYRRLTEILNAAILTEDQRGQNAE